MSDSILIPIIVYGLIFWLGVWFGELIYNGCKWWRRYQLKQQEKRLVPTHDEVDCAWAAGMGGEVVCVFLAPRSGT